jgi:hypothetical protein
MTTEKRRFSRIRPGIDVHVTAGAHHYRTNRVTDLGIGGCLLGIGMDLKPGDVCSLGLMLGDPDMAPEIKITAEAIRCQADSTALRFIGIDPDSLFHLQNLVRYNSEEPETIEEEIREHPGLI